MSPNPVTWVILAGLPGSGKSTLARALVERLGGVILDKDHVRDALFPEGTTDFSPEQDDLCFSAMLTAATYLARKGQPAFVFLDGRTFSRRAHLERALNAAEVAGARWRILHLTCPDKLAAERLALADPDHPASNRSVELYRRIQARAEPITRAKLDIDTCTDPEGSLERALAYLESPPK